MLSQESWRDGWSHLRRLIDADDYRSILISNFSRELLLIGIKYTFDCAELEEERAGFRSSSANENIGAWSWYEQDLQSCIPVFWRAFDEFANETAAQMREILRIRVKELADAKRRIHIRHDTPQSTKQIDADAEIASHMNAVYLGPNVSGDLDFTAAPFQQAHSADLGDDI